MTNAPRNRTVDALAGRDTGGTAGFFRALHDADYAIEQRDRLQARVDELEAHCVELKRERDVARREVRRLKGMGW